MAERFTQHYTVEQARQMLPRLRALLDQLEASVASTRANEQEVTPLTSVGVDVGGAHVNALLRSLADAQQILRYFQESEIQIKDLDRGLIDFPALIDGREVFLCWEKCEDDLCFFHDIESGFDGREPLPE